MHRLFLLATFIFAVSCASAQHLADNLNSEEGQAAEIHGAPQDLGHYVATVRDPDDFFKFEYFSLLTEKEEVREVFAKLKRNDKVRLWGQVSEDVHAPQRHLIVTKITITEPMTELPKHERQADFPASFPAEDVPFRALVHAIVKDKGLLVVEYKDAVLPVRVPASIELPNLYKNDIVEMKARIAPHPPQPKHLRVIELNVKESIVGIHGQPIEKTGALIVFPKSPLVQFDVYAVQENLPDGLSRQYTLVNFENPELFRQIREKAESLWKAADQGAIYNGRNKLVNPKLLVKVKGTGNVVDPGQANPQILISSLDDLQLVSASAEAKAGKKAKK